MLFAHVVIKLLEGRAADVARHRRGSAEGGLSFHQQRIRWCLLSLRQHQSIAAASQRLTTNPFSRPSMRWRDTPRYVRDFHANGCHHRYITPPASCDIAAIVTVMVCTDVLHSKNALTFPGTPPAATRRPIPIYWQSHQRPTDIAQAPGYWSSHPPSVLPAASYPKASQGQGYNACSAAFEKELQYLQEAVGFQSHPQSADMLQRICRHEVVLPKLRITSPLMA